MAHHPPGQAGHVLLSALLELAEEREDVRNALLEASELVRQKLGDGNPVASDQQDRGVLLPRARGRAEGAEERREIDLQKVVDRAAWKAEACRFVVDRRTAGPEQREGLIAREQDLKQRRDPLEDCFAWMLDSHRKLPGDERMQAIAACYDNVARAAAATLQLERESLLEPGPPSELLYLLAESQSALLASLQEVDLRGDSDQRDLFLWLKDQTTRHRIYVDRHMRLDDPADFQDAPGLARRVDDLVRLLIERRDARRQRGQYLNRLRYHLRKVVESTPPSADDVAAIEATVVQWCESGLPVGDRTLRNLLGSLRETMHGEGELPPRVQSILAASAESERTAGESGQGRPELLERARELLRGRRVLLFARPEEPEVGDQLAEALELEELRWVPLDETGEVETRLREEIDEEGVSLVLIALRLQVPDYALFKELCIERSRPFVRLPSGCGPQQVAHQVLRQVGRRLRTAAEQQRAQQQDQERDTPERGVQEQGAS